MIGWSHVAVAAVPAVFLFITAVYFITRSFCKKRDDQTGRDRTLQAGIAKLHQQTPQHEIDIPDSKRRTNYYVFRRGGGASTKPLFNWADHPSLVTDAVENGWSRFAFTGFMSSPSTKSTLLGLCAVGDRETEVDMSWEVCQGSADFMQKIRLNPGLKKINTTTTPSVIRTALPLPGPPLGNSSFPQEAYFEITILSSNEDDDVESVGGGKVKEGERTKLIQENSSSVKLNSDSFIHGNIGKLEEIKLGSGKDDDRNEVVMISVGFTGGSSLPMKLPGSYPGSIGFNSNGSVYLDGIKLALESEKAEWARKEKVVGCGFDPNQKKVFFTVDSELVHIIKCKSEEFGTPLYPTLAAKADIGVVVNFGQSMFKYQPANAQRTPNPCFIGPVVHSRSPAALSYEEDSKELFSMGRIDAQWMNRCTTKSSYNNGNNNRAIDFDDESEADLFEIALESRGRSPNIVL